MLEFGVGTGVYTEEILARIPAEARLLAFEVDRRISAAVARSIPDPRLTVVPESAEVAEKYLAGEGGRERADFIVSSLPFTTLPEPVGRNVLDLAQRVLAPEGAFLVLQYSRNIEPELRVRFASVRRTVSPLNLPPAFLFRCMAPLPARTSRR